MSPAVQALFATILVFLGGIAGAFISHSVEIATYFQNNAEAHSDLRALQQDMEESKVREAELKEQLTVVRKKLEEATHRLDIMDVKLNKAMDENASLVSQNAILISQHQQLMDQNERLQLQNDKLMDQHDQLLTYLQARGDLLNGSAEGV